MGYLTAQFVEEVARQAEKGLGTAFEPAWTFHAIIYRAILNAFEVVKINRQVGPEVAREGSSISAFLGIIWRDGIYEGLSKGIFLSSFLQPLVEAWIENRLLSWSVVSSYLSGFSAESMELITEIISPSIAHFIAYPLTNVKTQLYLQSTKMKYKTLFHGLWKLIPLYGPALWSGAFASATYEGLCRLILHISGTSFDQLLDTHFMNPVLGYFVRLLIPHLLQFAVYPLSTIARLLDAQIEMDEENEKSGPFVSGTSSWTLIGQVMKEEGILGFWRGYSLELGKISTRVALQLVHGLYVEPFLARYFRGGPHQRVRVPWWVDPRDLKVWEWEDHLDEEKDDEDFKSRPLGAKFQVDKAGYPYRTRQGTRFDDEGDTVTTNEIYSLDEMISYLDDNPLYSLMKRQAYDDQWQIGPDKNQYSRTNFFAAAIADDIPVWEFQGFPGPETDHDIPDEIIRDSEEAWVDSELDDEDELEKAIDYHFRWRLNRVNGWRAKSHRRKHYRFGTGLFSSPMQEPISEEDFIQMRKAAARRVYPVFPPGLPEDYVEWKVQRRNRILAKIKRRNEARSKGQQQPTQRKAPRNLLSPSTPVATRGRKASGAAAATASPQEDASQVGPTYDVAPIETPEEASRE